MKVSRRELSPVERVVAEALAIGFVWNDGTVEYRDDWREREGVFEALVGREAYKAVVVVHALRCHGLLGPNPDGSSDG